MPRAFSGGMPERPFLLARELAPDFERSQAAEDTQEQRVLIFPILARRTLARLRRATRGVNQ